MTLLAVSHGTSSPDGQGAVTALVDSVARARQELDVVAAFVDVQQPDVAASLAALDPRGIVVVVPLLLSAGYHVHVDLREELAAAEEHTAVLAAALGPDDRLVALLARRLREAGLRPGDRVVLAAAGSSDRRAVADCAETARRLGIVLRREVGVGFISAATPRLSDAVIDARAQAAGGRVVLASYLLAPGYFAALAHEAGADVVSAPLLVPNRFPPAELVTLVGERYDEAVASSLAATTAGVLS
ncbi:sirohydrochlorin ferrochelatase [Microterricola gilva]|uniref:Sirohydrochlorin ferrochelatase n=1 Tax=Microterricola gilva TaxID=393267 RepID=A0A4Q8AJV1_9MICO|nr:CbiX/SirB N-terminal domain-containing protein [Microterricola gilva]RZU64770.1 sirohydrochlorin ferrochelatase [Microterricola gilva]